MDYTCIFFGILFIAAGFIFACGKLHIHLAAWKNMPPDEKKKIRIRPLCRNIGEMIILNGSIFLTKGLWPAFTDSWFTAAMVLWMILAGIDVWYIEKSSRFRDC